MPQIPANDSAWSRAETEVPAEYLDTPANIGTPASMGAALYTPATTLFTPRQLGNMPLLFQWLDAFGSDGSESEA